MERMTAESSMISASMQSSRDTDPPSFRLRRLWTITTTVPPERRLAHLHPSSAFLPLRSRCDDQGSSARGCPGGSASRPGCRHTEIIVWVRLGCRDIHCNRTDDDHRSI